MQESSHFETTLVLRCGLRFDQVMSDLAKRQRARLDATIAWAAKMRAALEPLLVAHGARVHFRPSSDGVALVGLLHDRPQRGKGKLRNLAQVAIDFESMFAAHCQDVSHGRITGEKALQSFLIRDAYTHCRHMATLNLASEASDAPVDLTFVTDEIALPTESGKMVCDILALRRQGGRTVPVLLELKDCRMLKRLVEQVEGYAALIDARAEEFARLFSATLGEDVAFDGPCEKWIVWPAAGSGAEPREGELRERGIRVVGYREEGGRYSLTVGQGI